MTTLPNAVCSLHLEGDTTQSMKFLADEEGIVRFDAGGSEEANVATAFALDCEADGVPANSGNTVPIYMYNGFTPLSSPRAGSDTTRILFDWKAFH